MNIILFTSAMIESEFASFQNEAIVKPNPSNQNFYARLIKALSVNNRVIVVSHRPFVEGMTNEKVLPFKEDSFRETKYFYTKVKYSKRYKLFEEEKEIIKTARKAAELFRNNNYVVVVDTLRVNLLKAAIKFAKERKVKIVGMLTDNPANLSNVKKSYIKAINKNVLKLDGYLSLSNGLLVAMKVDEKPNYVFEGLVDEEIATRKAPIGNYYFFGGALYERYGVKNLIHAFVDSSLKERLVIAGMGPLRQYIFDNMEKNPRILYISQLPKEEIYGYEQNSIANINPRPYYAKLDRESVPSKMIEYLASGVPTISTMHTKLYELFKDEVFWIRDDSKMGIQKALAEFEKEDKKIWHEKATNAKKKVYELYGVRPQGERISYFLETLNSSLNR